MFNKLKWKLLLLVVIICVVAGFIACEDKGKEPIEPQVAASLVGTSWKLNAFVDIENNTTKEPESKNCEDCYTISFCTHDSASGRMIQIGFYANYISDYSNSTIQFTFINRPDAEDILDVELYYESLRKSQSFEFNSTELRLYYNDKKNYLLFQKIRE